MCFSKILQNALPVRRKVYGWKEFDVVALSKDEHSGSGIIAQIVSPVLSSPAKVGINWAEPPPIEDGGEEYIRGFHILEGLPINRNAFGDIGIEVEGKSIMAYGIDRGERTFSALIMAILRNYDHSSSRFTVKCYCRGSHTTFIRDASFIQNRTGELFLADRDALLSLSSDDYEHWANVHLI